MEPLRVSFATVLRASDSGLMGQDYEYAPRIKSYATWGDAQRVISTSAVVPISDTFNAESGAAVVGPYAAPDLARDGLNGDESIWLKLISKSRYSGMPEIDEALKKKEEFDVQSGTVRLPMSDVLEAAATGTPLALPLHDPLLTIHLTQQALKPLEGSGQIPQLTAQNEMEIAQTTYKGSLLAIPKLESGTPTQALALAQQLRTLAQKPRDMLRGEPLVYGSPEMIKAMIDMKGTLIEGYARSFFGELNEKGDVVKQPTYPIGPDESGKNVHLPLVTFDQGALPAIAMSQHTLQMREQLKPLMAPAVPDPNLGASSKPTRESALLFNAQIDSVRMRYGKGITAAQMVEAERLQSTQSHSDPTLRADYLLTQQLFLKTATDIANQVRYQKDMRYPNVRNAIFPAAAATPPPSMLGGKAPKVISSLVLTMGKHIGRCLAQSLNAQRDFTLLTGARLASTGVRFLRDTSTEAGEKKVEQAGPEIEIECVFPVALYGLCATDDCDGSGCTAATVLRQATELAAAVTPQEAPLLHAMAKVASRRFAMEIACSVSGAYLDSSGKKLSTEALRKIEDLPKIGSPEDKQCETGGHAPAIWLSKAVMLQHLQAGIGRERVAADLPQLANINFAAWEYREPVFVAEGTAAMDPLVLPVGEVVRALLPNGNAVAAQFENADLSRKAFLKSELVSKSEDAPKNPLIEHMHVDRGNYYSRPVDTSLRTSSFYRAFAVGNVPELYKMNPLYGQLNFVDPSTKTRVVESGAFLRAPLNATPTSLPTKTAFVPSFAAHTSRVQYDTYYKPVMAVIQNQLPVMNLFSSLKSQEEGLLAQRRIGHVLSPAVLLACPSVAMNTPNPVSSLTQALDRHALGLQRRAANAALSQRLGAPLRGAATSLGSGASPVTIFKPLKEGQLPIQPSVVLSMHAWKLAEPGVANSLVSELERLKASGKILDYAAQRDRPLRDGEDVISVVLSLPLVESTK